jgi:hypothetical protein
MKSINTDAWLDNFMLSLVGPKVNFFKFAWHRRLQQCAHLLDSTQPKWAHPNQIASKKLQLGPRKSVLGYMNNANLQEEFWAQPNYK